MILPVLFIELLNYSFIKLVSSTIINCTSLMVDPRGPLPMSSCDNLYGSKCKFSCTIGHRLNGSSAVTCVASGNQRVEQHNTQM